MLYAHITNTKAYTVKRAIYICANLQLEMSEQYESFIKTLPLQLTVGWGLRGWKGVRIIVGYASEQENFHAYDTIVAVVESVRVLNT